jgi:hypothetical protein
LLQDDQPDAQEPLPLFSSGCGPNHLNRILRVLKSRLQAFCHFRLLKISETFFPEIKNAFSSFVQLQNHFYALNCCLHSWYTPLKSTAKGVTSVALWAPSVNPLLPHISCSVIATKF